MRKLILSIPITIDGFIEGPHRELDWVIADDEMHDYFSNLLENGDLLLYGRVTYQLMVNYWPTATSDPSLPKSMHRFANTLNPMPKIVYSKTLKGAGWNTQVRDSLDPQEILELKKRPGRDILLGGGAILAQSFIRYGLVDEFRPVIQPVAIGEGTPLFKGLQDKLKLEYMWSRKFSSGAVALCYHVDGKLQSPTAG